MKNILLITSLAAFSVISCHKASINEESDYFVIPKPASLISEDGSFVFKPGTRILYNNKSQGSILAVDFLTELINSSSGMNLESEFSEKAERRSVFFDLEDNSNINEEAYILDISQSGIHIKASDPAGLFYGVQTLRQLLPVRIEDSENSRSMVFYVPACHIEDEPRFAYRGMHLDVGRHLFPIDYILRYIDMLAMHKMNRFHWHLTEDQGWRIEIDKYPLLTEVGAWRDETLIGHGGKPPFEYDGKVYGGYYSKEQVREIVKYASDRFITVIPEIEMPGHALAALAAYPELSCTGGPHEVAKRWGVMHDVYCAGKEETFLFLQNVLDEVIGMFPSEYIHIGGDECPKTRWELCPDCQVRINEEGLADEHELQSYFIKRIADYLLSKDRRIIGWDEILEGGLAPEATVMSWRGVKGGIEAARLGHDVIMTPNSHMYLDYYQCEPEGEPLAIGGYLPLERVYSYEPLAPQLNEEEGKHILGVQGNLWSEYLSTPEYMEYMAYPRFFAVSEVAWSKQGHRDFEDFLVRLKANFLSYDIIGINYFKGEYYDTRKRSQK